MARWQHKDPDRLEKMGRVRKRQKKTHVSSDLQEDYESPESEWALGGKDGSFAARVVEVHKRYAFVSSEPEVGKVQTHDVWLAEVARKYLVADRLERNFVAVGDRVLCTPATTLKIEVKSDLPKCVIQHLAPRRARIARLDPHTPTRLHVLATNMDQVMIVASYLSPTVKWGLIDRYLVLAESEGVGAIIVLNKLDLLEQDTDADFVARCVEMESIYSKLGYPFFSLTAGDPSREDKRKIKEIKALLAGKVTLLSGHSGVGKSTLVNLYDPEIVQPVEENSDIFYKGRHTTTYASFIKLGTGGFVIDTPGIRSFTFDEKSAIELSHCFVEFRPFLGQCKYRECRHLEEPECVIRTAVEEGKISRVRYKSYLAILLGASGREGRIRDLPLDE